MQRDAHADPISLGIPVDVENNYLYSLNSHYLPLGKIGGKPSWLNPKNIPTSEQLECKPNDASNFTVFRCILPRANDYYSFEGPIDPDFDGDVPNPLMPKDAPHLCEVCGCFASKKCGKCGDVWYCCRDHQALDWTTLHKPSCGQPKKSEEKEEEIKNPSNIFLFKEYGICLENEFVPGNLLEELPSDDEEDDGNDTDDETEKEREKRLKDYNTFIDSQRGKNEDITVDDVEAATADQSKDRSFERFMRLINLNPDQIVRYQRCGEPLCATDKAPPLPEPEDIPTCDICGSPRRFEFQLTPHLLSLMEVDSLGKSIDFAGVYIYTCMRSCEIPKQGYAKEFVVKQDFI